ncbi:endoribonuclease Dicer homolog 2 isoform X1 [Setaria viridis]|uniref:endoribonuclease Dicer homolog 2 isoform X1 n=1 Tax=Setaria viridis TaxID=4556 RepID=UPI0014938E30|nr:endoribonuclease Dicer homolog 2-like isoform X1 [Setaria viridis]
MREGIGDGADLRDEAAAAMEDGTSWRRWSARWPGTRWRSSRRAPGRRSSRCCSSAPTRTASAPPCFAVFLVPTVVLVGQQALVIKDPTDLRVEQFYGEMGVDYWDADTWRRTVDGAEVLVMTPQILLDDLRHCFFTLRDIALLIFDECHHAHGNPPTPTFLRSLERWKLSLLFLFCDPRAFETLRGVGVRIFSPD